ncbi:MAG: heterodisulfide reductase-related iron-sulfur binding cluster [Steroidobacteraceae bacterium]
MLNSIDITEPPKKLPTGNGGIYEAPRTLLALAGFEMVEFERRRELSYCCGAAGGAKEAFPGFADKAAQSRRNEAGSVGATAIATACGSCLSHLNAAGASIPALGLYSLLAQSLSKKEN